MSARCRRARAGVEAPCPSGRARECGGSRGCRHALVVAGAAVTGREARWNKADGVGGRDEELTDGRSSQWRGRRRLAGGDWRVRKRVEVARVSERLTIG